MSSIPLISIVVPVKNAKSWINELLKALAGQSIADQAEIICIDSGSTDGTPAIIREYPVRLIEIDSTDFNHGDTRNLGVRHAQGRFVVMTVQDAIPADNKWLEKLLEGFTDENVAGVCGLQVVPHEKDKNPVQWFRPISSPQIKRFHFSDPLLFDGLPPEKKKAICSWDDVTACYRKAALMEVPFRQISFAEDAAWAMDALRSGYAIVYNPAARVFHYHHENYDFAFRRSLTVFYHRYTFFRYLPGNPANGLKQHLRTLKLLLKENIPVRQKIYWWKYNRQLNKAVNNAYNMFSAAIEKGDDAVDQLYEQYCSTIPIAS